MRGWFVQQRHYLARFAARWPRVTILGIRTRKWWWWLAGWPFSVAALWTFRLTLLFGLFTWFLPTGLLPTAFNAARRVLSAWPTGQDGVLVAGAVLGVAVYGRWWWKQNIEADVVGLVSMLWVWGIRGMVVVNAALVLPWALVAGLFLAIWVGVAADLITADRSRFQALLRSYAEFRRELPDHWTDLAARSSRIQSIDVGLERTVAEAANERPILEHPGLGGLFDTLFNLEEFKVTVPVARPEGRSLAAFEEILDELAAQYFSVADGPDAIRVVATDAVRSNFASWAWLEISFKPPTSHSMFPGWSTIRTTAGLIKAMFGGVRRNVA